MSDSLIARVIDVVANVLEVDPSDLGPDSGVDTVEMWDSFAQLNIMVALEDEFGLELDPEDSTDMMSVSAIAGVLQARLPQ